MPSILQYAGIYFDLLNIKSIYSTLLKLKKSNNGLGQSNSIKSYKFAHEYFWEKCANQIFEYFNKKLFVNA